MKVLDLWQNNTMKYVEFDKNNNPIIDDIQTFEHFWNVIHELKHTLIDDGTHSFIIATKNEQLDSLFLTLSRNLLSPSQLMEVSMDKLTELQDVEIQVIVPNSWEEEFKLFKNIIGCNEMQDKSLNNKPM